MLDAGALVQGGQDARDRVGEIVYPATVGDADKVMEAAIEAGADDVESDEEGHWIYTSFESMNDVSAALEKSLGELQAATMWFMANGMKNPDNVGAGAVSYMHLMGLVATGLMWLRMATAASRLKANGDAQFGPAFLDAKLVTARFFAERVLPEAGALRRKIEGGAEAVMALPPEMFLAA